MSDAISNAHKIYRLNSEWLESKGWKQDPSTSVQCYIDPLGKYPIQWQNDAVDIQRVRDQGYELSKIIENIKNSLPKDIKFIGTLKFAKGAQIPIDINCEDSEY